MGSMTDDLIDVREAAKLLEVTTRTIENMVKSGMLTPVFKQPPKEKVQRFFSLSEVAAVANLKSMKIDVATTANMAIRALTLAQSTQRQLEDITALLGFDSRSLPIDEVEIVALQIRIQEALERVDLMTAVEVKEWAKIFLNVTEEYLRLVAQYVKDERPWKGFLLLAEKIGQEEHKNGDQLLLAAHAFMETARKHLRQVAYFYARVQEGRHPAARIIPKATGIDEDLISLLFIDR